MRKKRLRSTPGFYRQETPDSCAIACLRSVLHTYDYVIDERKLSKLCGTASSETLADDLVKCTRLLGFEVKEEYSNLESLQHYLATQRFPILYLNLLFIDGVDSVHAVVVIEVKGQFLHVMDPLDGFRFLPLAAFEESWKMLNNLAIIVWQSKT